MNGLKNEYISALFKQAFLQYVSDTHPKWTARTCQTCVSDALFVNDNLPKNTMNHILQNTAWTPALENFLIDILVLDLLALRKNPIKDAKGYVRAFRVYFSFIQIMKLIENSKIDKPRDIRW